MAALTMAARVVATWGSTSTRVAAVVPPRAAVAWPRPRVAAHAPTASCARARAARAGTAAATAVKAAATAAKAAARAAPPPRAPTAMQHPKPAPATPRPASRAARVSPATERVAATPLHAVKASAVRRVALTIVPRGGVHRPETPVARQDRRPGRWHRKGRGRRRIRRGCAAGAMRRRVHLPPPAACRCPCRPAAVSWLCARETVCCRSQASIAVPPVSARSPRR